jgi:hypothetical protein
MYVWEKVRLAIYNLMADAPMADRRNEAAIQLGHLRPEMFKDKEEYARLTSVLQWLERDENVSEVESSDAAWALIGLLEANVEPPTAAEAR